jgi:beta-N-acetylhexosaminidase
MAAYSPVIFGIEGLNLSADEAAFFHDVRPWGLILFARNIESLDQLRGLTDSLREILWRADLPILIDQEGGRVARLRPPLVAAYPPMGLYGDMFTVDRARAY